MRVIGNIDHPILKITAFKMDNKLSIKFESGLFEQTYKIRESEQLSTFEDLQNLVDEGFINDVIEELKKMNQIKKSAFSRYLTQAEEDEFEDII